MTIMPDCAVDQTIAGMMTSFFGNAGQRCLAAANAVIVGEDDDFYNEFVSKVVAMAKKIKVGYGLDESVQMGPLRDPAKKQNVLNYIDIGIKEGAELLLDGREFTCRAICPRTASLDPPSSPTSIPSPAWARRRCSVLS
jgi:malonate-semialdehyde dehydrogenase (acetylating)/methylmalonate-semialdehyde dehydrogenase